MDINVKITTRYKSVGACEFSLQKFCVLTGKNGSGKTHILEAMAQIAGTNSTNRTSKQSSHVTNGINKTVCQNIKKILFGQLNPTITEQCDPDEINKFIKEVSNYITQRNKSSISEHKRVQFQEFIEYVRGQKGLSSQNDISEDDLKKYFDIKFMGNDDMLAGKFALIFKNYARIRDSNLYNRYKQAQGYATTASGELLSDDEFIKKYGIPPWGLVNGIFERVNIPYSVNNPENDDRDSNFTLELCDRMDNNICIKCSDLSTGEKVLMALAMAIYNSDTNCKKPDLLLIDEPDAGLHPSMSKNMVNVLREFIVEKLEIPVVITTHSPTTIAALDDVEIYEKVRGVDIPKKVTKEEALTLLTSDIPFLTVSVEKRRAVFVESQYDADIYSELYEIFKDKIATEPHFFPFYKDKNEGSNCQNVINSTNNFKNCGDIQVYGIVDCDEETGRTSHDNLLVLGDGERYAIENYILDPLLVALFLIVTRENKFSDFGITKLTTYLDLDKLNQNEAQQIVDSVLLTLGFANGVKSDYVLFNDWKLRTAQSILTMQGHNLEKKYKEKYPCLNQYNVDAQKGKNLKYQIVDAIIKPRRSFLSKNVLETLLRIK